MIQHFTLKPLRLLAMASLLGLAACANTPTATRDNFSTAINRFRGEPIDSLVAQWGPPDSEFQMQNKNTIYQWKHQYTDVRIYPVTRPVVGWGWWGWYPAYSGFDTIPVPINRSCTTRLTVEPTRIIRDIWFEGDGCVAYPTTASRGMPTPSE